MFVSRKKMLAMQAELVADREWFAEQANELWEEATLLREFNTQWQDLYEFNMKQIDELIAENERLRSWNYDLMGYENDSEVPF